MKEINPADFPDYHHQTKQTDFTEEQFNNLFKPLSPTKNQKIIRFIIFIISLGPIRLLLFVLTAIVFSILLFIWSFILDYFPNLKSFAFQTISPIARLGFFLIGFTHISIHGQIEPTTRTLISNHLSFWDPMISFSLFKATFLTLAGAKSSVLVKALGKVIGFIFVDRSKKEGVTETIIKTQKDKSYNPVWIYPEGKVTNGSAILGFRTGSFVSDTPIQAVCFRYKSWFSSNKWATISWLNDSILDYLYQFLSIPMNTIEITILPQIDTKGMSTQEKAVAYQLQMANFLGVPAIKQTNRQLPQKQD